MTQLGRIFCNSVTPAGVTWVLLTSSASKNRNPFKVGQTQVGHLGSVKPKTSEGLDSRETRHACISDRGNSKIERLDAPTMLYRATITDPERFSRPWRTWFPISQGLPVLNLVLNVRVNGNGR